MENEWVNFRLTDPCGVLIEPIGASGFTNAGVFVIDQELNNPADTTMFVRVIGKASDKSPDVKLGAVYLVPVYCWEDFTFEDEVWHLTHEYNLKCEIEGYDQWDTPAST